MNKEIFFMDDKILDLSYYNEIKNINNELTKLEESICLTNEDDIILLDEIKKYNGPKFLYYGKNSLLNLLKDKKESRRILINNKYNILANLLYKYRNNMNEDLYRYIILKDKLQVFDYVINGNGRYLLRILDKSDIDYNLLRFIIFYSSSILRNINLTSSLYELY